MEDGLDGEYFNSEDCSKFTNVISLKDWKVKDTIESIRDRFVTGDWLKASQRNQNLETNTEEDYDACGDFEDLETGKKYEGNQKDDDEDDAYRSKDELVDEERRLKKLALRAKFDAQYPFTCCV